MKIKRLLSGAIALSIILTCFAGCDSSDSSAGSSSSAADNSSSVSDSSATDTPNGTFSSDLVDGIIIAEVMGQNKDTVEDENGKSGDYILLYNGGEATSLSGYKLSDDKATPDMWSFPDVTIEKDSFLLVFADGTDTNGTYMHTNFSIGADGEKIFLTDASGKTTEFYVPAMPADVAYGFVFEGDGAGQYHYFKSGSPNGKNSSEHSADLAALMGTKVVDIRLNEYMTANKKTINDNYGESSDWIELYNPTDADVDLSGFTITDSYSNPNKWTIPEGVTIKSGEYLLIWFDGLDEYKDGHMHASFKLSAEDDGIMMTDKEGYTVFKVDMKATVDDISCGLDANGEYVFFSPATPGAENSSEGYKGEALSLSFDEKDIFISEVSPLSGNGAKKDYDWIELCNKSENDINLNGWGIGRNSVAPEYTFTDETIKSGGYILLYADGGENYLPFKISLDGEQFFLFNDKGQCCDSFESAWIAQGNSCGRSGSDELCFFKNASPGIENEDYHYKGYAQVPELSINGGYCNSGDKITPLSSDGVTLRFTDDGTKPTRESTEFSSYTVGDKNTVLRVRAYKDGYLPSEVESFTFITEQKHDIPFVALSCDPQDLFSDERGILAFGTSYSEEFPYVGANFWEEWEREASFEYYTADGKKQLGCLAGIKVFGQYSRAYDQKSLAVHFRGKYGTSSVEYPFFEGNSVTEFESLVLRAGGQDQKYTRIRDAFCSEIISSCTSLAYMDWQPIAVYINGEYYGFYDLREKINEAYFEYHEGIDKDNISIIKGNRIELAGSVDDYEALRKYVREHDLSDPEVYAYVESQIDIDNYIDYLIAEIFLCNGDTGNIKFYRNDDGGKWKWVFFDLDMALRGEATWENDYNSIKKLFNPEGHGASNMFFTTMQCGLLESPQFRDKFSRRYAELLNTAFLPENLNAKIDEMAALMDSEMVLHGQRWDRPSYDSWKSSIRSLKDICSKRRAVAKKQFIDFMELSDEQVKELFPNG